MTLKHPTPPVLFLTFNRPEKTAQALESIKKAQPSRIYISNDGPRDEKPEDQDKTHKVREILKKGITWDCQVQYLFNKENLGCADAVHQAINWFFLNEESGIILEDDCLADPTFFPYCAELLEYYKDDTRIMHIGGCNHGFSHNENSYYFSQHMHIWGWATWRRAWEKYDFKLSSWNAFKKSHRLTDVFGSQHEATRRYNNWDNTYQGKINTWDYQWSYSVISNGGLGILPNVNLVKNIGHDAEATHTCSSNASSNLNTYPITFPLRHPLFKIENRPLDQRYNDRLQPTTSIQKTSC